jgi:hypothetical protein
VGATWQNPSAGGERPKESDALATSGRPAIGGEHTVVCSAHAMLCYAAGVAGLQLGCCGKPLFLRRLAIIRACLIDLLFFCPLKRE